MSGEEDDDPSVPGILIIWDDHHECLLALPVENKGPVDWVVKWIVEKLHNVGYRGQTITLKSDQEPFILAPKNVVAAKRVGITTPINLIGRARLQPHESASRSP